MRNLKTVNYEGMFTLSAPSPKWVWNAQGQLVEVPAGQPAFGYDRFTGEPIGQIIESTDATNVLLNSFAPATQTVSVSDATEYTLSVYGSGSAEITAGGSGTATDGSPLTFTTTGTSVTVTVTGSLDVFQLETGSVATSPIETTDSAVTRAGDALTIPNLDTADWYGGTEGAFLIEFSDLEILPSTQALILSDGVSLRWIYARPGAALSAYDGENRIDSGNGAGNARAVVTWNADTMKFLATSGDIATGPHGGSLSTGTQADLFGDNVVSINLHQLRAARRMLSDSEMHDWVNGGAQ